MAYYLEKLQQKQLLCGFLLIHSSLICCFCTTPDKKVLNDGNCPCQPCWRLLAFPWLNTCKTYALHTSNFYSNLNGVCLTLNYWLFQDIEFVQVPALLSGGEILTATILNLIIWVACHIIVNSAVRGILVGTETILPIMVEEGVVAGHLVEVRMGLGLVLAPSEVKV